MRYTVIIIVIKLQKLKKDKTAKKSVDKQANYCVKIDASAPNIFGQCTIYVTNTR